MKTPSHPARSTLISGLLAVVLVLGAPAAGSAAEAPPAPGPKIDTTAPWANRILVRFSAGTPSDAASRAVAASGGRVAGEIPEIGWRVVQAPGSLKQVASRLRRDSRVESVEQEQTRQVAQTPNDPYYPDQTHLRQARLPEAWASSHGSGRVIAILDTGVDLDHPDLIDHLVPGRDFVNGDASADDDNGHGTMVAGVAAASTDNSRGVAGVAWDARLLPVKVLDAFGSGADSNIAKGIIWATDNGAHVINLSLGGKGQSTVLRDAVAYALSKDVVVVAAAGNDGEPVTSYPASAPGVVAVTATDALSRLASFSNWSSATDVAAEGVDVLSTYWEPTEIYRYGYGSGTSFAAPVVSGVAALVRAAHPTWSQSQVVEAILESATDAGPLGTDPYFGRGIVDAAAALGATPRPPFGFTGDSHEPDGAASTAWPLSSSASATIVPEGDTDWYKTDASGPGTLSFNVVPPRTPAPPNADSALAFDPVLQVFDSSLNMVAEADVTGTDTAESVSVTVTSPGRYYLRVANYLGSRSPGTYSVSATGTALTVAAPTSPTTPTTVAAPPTTTTTASPSPSPAPPPPAPAPAPRSGYWMVGQDGTVYPFGDARGLGNTHSSNAVVDLEPTPSGDGYWTVDEAGRVFAVGDAPYLGGVGGLSGDERATSLSATPTGRGYWVFTTKGRVIPFGNASFLGDMSRTPLNGPVLDSIPTPSGQGYYMVASDGGIFTFGDAVFHGSMGSVRLNAPVQSLVPDRDGAGYWLVASDGGIFAFDAEFHGSMGSTRLNRAVTGMVGYGRGYLMVAEDGGIFTFGDAPFYGSLGDRPPASPITSVAILG